ncbi:MAG: hypothetical protein ACSHX8_08500 [Opitutaceae bacterium]
MEKNTQNIGFGRQIFRFGKSEALYFTTKCYFVLTNLEGETIVSYDEAANWAAEHGFCSDRGEFNFLIHSPSGEIEESTAPDDVTFEAEKEVELANRFNELLQMRPFGYCFISHDSISDFVELDYDQHDEIKRMYDQERDSYGHFGSNFSALLTSGNSKWMDGHIIGPGSKYWSLNFWCYQPESRSVGFQLPHVWVKVNGSSVDTKGQLELIGRCAAKAILTFQISREASSGRDPFRDGISEFAGDPNLVLKKKVFSDTPRGSHCSINYAV